MLELPLWTDDSEQWQHSHFSMRVRACDDVEWDLVCELRAEQLQVELLKLGLFALSVEPSHAEHWRGELERVRV